MDPASSRDALAVDAAGSAAALPMELIEQEFRPNPIDFPASNDTSLWRATFRARRLESCWIRRHISITSTRHQVLPAAIAEHCGSGHTLQQARALSGWPKPAPASGAAAPSPCQLFGLECRCTWCASVTTRSQPPHDDAHLGRRSFSSERAYQRRRELCWRRRAIRQAAWVSPSARLEDAATHDTANYALAA